MPPFHSATPRPQSSCRALSSSLTRTLNLARRQGEASPERCGQEPPRLHIVLWHTQKGNGSWCSLPPLPIPPPKKSLHKVAPQSSLALQHHQQEKQTNPRPEPLFLPPFRASQHSRCPLQKKKLFLWAPINRPVQKALESYTVVRKTPRAFGMRGLAQIRKEPKSYMDGLAQKHGPMTFRNMSKLLLSWVASWEIFSFLQKANFGSSLSQKAPKLSNSILKE